MRRSFIGLGIGVALGIAGLGVPAQAEPVMVVNQGDMVISENGDYCTIGYVDALARQSFTAAHCAPDGGRVGFVDSEGIHHERVGVLARAAGYRQASGANDFAIIRWDEDVVMGANQYSGDRRLTAGDVQVGDTVCYQGTTTHGYSGEYSCGAYRDKLGNSVLYYVKPDVRPGDSGGPVWVPGKGFLAVTSLGAYRWSDTEAADGVQVAVIPTEGPIYNDPAITVVTEQALSAKGSSEDPFNPAVGQASSYRYGEQSSERMAEGSSHDFLADEERETQVAVFWTLIVATVASALGLVGGLGALLPRVMGQL